MDVRLSVEQRALQDAAARLASDLGPKTVADLDDAERRAKLDAAVEATGWRELLHDASAVEAAIVIEEFARHLVDVPFIAPLLELGAPGAGFRHQTGPVRKRART